MHRTKSGRFAKGHAHRKTHRRRSGGARRHHRRSRRRGMFGGGAPSMLTLGLAGAGLMYATKNSATVSSLANRIPGSATFGPAATLGVAALAVDKFLWRNKYLRAAGYAGVVLAMAKFGEQGTDFKWLGDVGDDATINLEGDDLDGDDAYDALAE
jgi:hypothetical protein